jgi:hypothetical protein
MEPRMTSPRLLRDLLPPEFRPGLETLARPPHTRRVVMLGDSYTFGFGLPEREGLAGQLEVELNRTTPGALFEVLNLGRPGLNLLEELAVFDMVSAELAHDLVVVSLGDDDAHPWTRNELAHLGGRWEEQWRGQWAEDNPAAPFLKDGLRELARRTRAAGTPLVVTYFQSVAASDLPVRRLRALCQGLEVPFVDLLAPFARFERGQLIISPVDCHPTAFAHRIAAVELARSLKPLLSSQEELTWPQVEAVVGFAEAVELGRPQPAGVACRHLARLATARAARPHRDRLRAWQGSLRDAQEDALRAALGVEVLRRCEGDLGMLHDGVFRLSRERWLSGVGAMVPDPQLGRLTEAFAGLGARRAEVSAALEAVAARLEAAPRPPPEAPARLAARMEAVQAELRREAQATLPAIRDGLERVARLVEGPAPDPEALIRVGPSAIYHHLMLNLAEWRRRLTSAALRLDAGPGGWVEVEVAAPSQGLLNMTLFGTFTRRHPGRGAAVQHQYVVMDGQPRAYRFDPIPGAIQTFSLGVKGFRDWRGAEPLDGSDHIRGIWWVCGDRRVALDPADPLMAPL